MKDKADEVVMSPMTTAALVAGIKKGRGRLPKVKTPFLLCGFCFKLATLGFVGGLEEFLGDETCVTESN
ncbi:uncharacterized protein A4U43_C10F5770 [Asparagus officinalis]|uniref:Uncharacterized protein n=1 Tax=Asparagus officinalis TaxID=4686 RepID=A0A5P1E0Z0_ASPOF|nr:uncharacterized protein A4U43_C10F5770 [Asparagus officinalis]